MQKFISLILTGLFAWPAWAASTRLGIVSHEPIESVQPYDRYDGVYSSRPAVLDDLVYESLFVKDPVYNSDQLHPLIARSLQWSADFSALTFELDPLAKFQDGSSVTSDDILFSIEEYKRSHAGARDNIERWIQSIEVQGLNIIFHLQSQEARPRIADVLAQIKIVKPSRFPEPKLSGISVNFVGTGAYRIAQLGPSKLVLVRNPFYWAGFLPLRRNLFNFSTIEVSSYSNETDADNALTTDASNFSAKGRTNRIETSIQQLRARNPRLVLRRQLDNKIGEPLSSYAFNLSRPALQDPRVRQALFLAFDYDKINQNAFSFSLNRPLSLLERSAVVPAGLPSDESLALLQECSVGEELPPEVFSDFSTYGTNLYRRFNGDRARLLEASKLLQLAGYRLINGKLTKNGQPLKVRILVRDLNEMPIVTIYQDALVHMGIQVELETPGSRAAFQRAVDLGDYDLRTAEEVLLTADGMPEAARYTNPSGQRSPCMEKMLRNLAEWTAAADVFARLHQAFYLGIFIGEPRYRDFIMDERIRVPDGLSYSRAHAYGFWQPDNP